jgi:predicted cupin superfamily sugar epimerase
MLPQNADYVIETLGLKPHPEGGYYSETFRDASAPRGTGTAIYFLLRENQVSHWHRIDATEIFHFYAGLPLEINLWQEGQPVRREILGASLSQGQRPALVIAPGTWQKARPLRVAAGLADYSLLGCTVTPAFEFQGFELAADGWEPPAF